MSINTIIEILTTYRESASTDPDYEVLVPGDILEAMLEHLEILDEPKSDREQLVECFHLLDTLKHTCPDETVRPIIGKCYDELHPLMYPHIFG
jgi:hypothetical protein